MARSKYRSTPATAIRDAYEHNQSITPNPAKGLMIFDPDHPDFWSYGNRIELAKLGIFSVDQPAHRKKRAQEAAAKAHIEAAYARLGLDREQVKNRIAAKLEAGKNDGIWARSTGEYSRLVAGFDREVLAIVERTDAALAAVEQALAA